jgi:hypothetical protein
MKSKIIGNNLIVATFAYDNNQTNSFNVFCRKINKNTGKIIDEKKMLKYPRNEEININGLSKNVRNSMPSIFFSSDFNYLSINYQSTCEVDNQRKIKAMILDANLKEQYHIEEFWEKGENIVDQFLSKSGDFFVTSFLINEEQEKKYLRVHKYNLNTSIKMEYELPYSILGEDDYAVNYSRTLENKDGKILITTLLGEDDLLGILFSTFNEKKDSIITLKMLEINEEIAKGLSDDESIDGPIAIDFISYYDDNNLFLLLEENRTGVETNSNMSYRIGKNLYFLAFDENFNILWKKGITGRNIYFATNGDIWQYYRYESCSFIKDDHLNLYVELLEPSFGLYKYEINLKSGLFETPKYLFTRNGGFTVTSNKYFETDKGILFVSSERDGSSKNGNIVTYYYLHRLYHIMIK